MAYAMQLSVKAIKQELVSLRNRLSEAMRTRMRLQFWPKSGQLTNRYNERETEFSCPSSLSNVSQISQKDVARK